MPAEIIENLEQQIDIALYLRILNKRKNQILLIAALFTSLAVLHSFIAKPIYRAETKILIQKKTPRASTLQDAVSGQPSSYGADSQYDFEFLLTQISILKSSILAKRVVDVMDFANRAKLPSNCNSTEVLQKMMNAENPRKTYVVKLSIESTDPILAADVANNYTNEYIKFVLKEKSAVSDKALGMLQQRRDELRKKLEESELELQKYGAENKITSFEEEKQDQIKRISNLNADLTEARSKRLELEALYNKYQSLINDGVSLEELPLVKDNPGIQELKSDYFKKEAIYTENLQKFTEDHPIMVQLKTELSNLRGRIRQQIIKAIEGIKSEYETSASREEGLSKALEEEKKLSWEINDKTVKLEDLQREVNADRELYTDLVQKMKEVDLGSEFLISSITVLDKAEVPSRPIKPKKLRDIILALFFGISGGIALAFSLERIDLSVRTSEDIDNYLGLPFLGFIPALNFNNNIAENRLIIYSDSQSSASEALRSIRANINFIFSGQPKPLAFLISSSFPQEGKSFSAVNIAIAMASANEKVLLVDCDLRRPTLHKILEVDNGVGLTDYLSKSAKLEQVIQNTIVDNLSVVTCGKLPNNPVELLESEVMKRFIEEAKNSYFRVIIDSAPILSVTDSLILSHLVDGVIFVIRSGKTPCGIVVDVKKKLLNASAKITGVVLNRINMEKESYYYNYYQYESEKKDGQHTHKHKKSRNRLSED